MNIELNALNVPINKQQKCAALSDDPVDPPGKKQSYVINFRR